MRRCDIKFTLHGKKTRLYSGQLSVDIEIFTNDEKHITQDWSRHIIKLTAESAELKNETNKNIFAILQESILLPDNYTDIVFSLKN